MPYALYDRNGDRISLLFSSIEQASGSQQDVQVWKEDPAASGTWNGWRSAEPNGAPDFTIKPAATRGSGTEVCLQSTATITGMDTDTRSERWEVVCWECGDAWDSIPTTLPTSLQEIRGPWRSKDRAEERRDAHRAEHHRA